ncbi:signal peptidase I [Agromyces sp. Leaf222]|uniref:signal peptidase I n=1 Tax=Agromyces sp. Leaf222 TaxID=1735688 RepID=UPI000B2799FC|nr:signal peptidase I [Agromyces sp. Leaf222]
MRVLRAIGSTMLWVLAGLGVLSGLMWGASALGLLHPLIVVSGSMQPGIRTGDLVVGVPRAIEEVTPGDVITLTSTQTRKLVTHRVVAIEPSAGGFAVTMKGDANDAADAEAYAVPAGSRVPTPLFVVPGGGFVVETISRPPVAIPLLIALAALVGLAMLPSGRPRDDEADDGADSPTDAAASVEHAPSVSGGGA